jgi:hypothetical protein
LSYPSLAFASPGNTEPRSLQLHIEVHAENTCGWVILDTKINVLSYTKSKVACTLQ